MNSHNRRTLRAVFTRPVVADINWSSIEALVRALGGDVSQGSGSRVRFHLNGRKAVFHRGLGGSMATIEYEGYVARIELDEDEKVLHGRVINISDVVTFEAAGAPQLLREFKRSMKDYFAFCKKRGEEPDKPFSGKFVLRVDPAVHRAIAVAADREAKSINRWAEEALARAAAG